MIAQALSVLEGLALIALAIGFPALVGNLMWGSLTRSIFESYAAHGGAKVQAAARVPCRAEKTTV